jgi:hypothetical protein
MNSPFAARLLQPDVVDKPDWEAANILNSPDPSLPEIVSLKSRPFGVGTILELFGVTEGVAFLSTLELLAVDDPVFKWSLKLLQDAALDAASTVLRAQLDGLVETEILTSVQANLIKALAEEKRYPSWAEANNIEVTARTVGLERGGK